MRAGGYDLVLEPFGGSAVLSVNLYKDGIVKEAIINDYDGLFDIYEEYLDIKDWLVNKCYSLGIYKRTGQKKPYQLRDINNNVVGSSNYKCLSYEERKILQRLVKDIPTKFWRIFSFSGNFCHGAIGSQKEVKLRSFSYFISDLKTDKQREYLQVVQELERDSLDYKDFLEKHRKKINSRTLLLIDPPYTGTYQSQYKEQFDYKRTQELIDLVKSLNCDFIFFNSDMENVKSWLKELDYSIELSGNKNATANRNRKDILAYVQATNSGLF